MQPIVTDNMILNHGVPQESAKKCIDNYRLEGVPTFHFCNDTGNMWHYKDGRHQIIKDMAAKKMILDFLNGCKCIDEKDSKKVLPFNATTQKIADIYEFIKLLSSEGIRKDPLMGSSWIYSDFQSDLPDPKCCVRFKNGILSFDKFVKTKNAKDSFFPNTPRFFSSATVPLDIHPMDYGRLKPVKWLAFLDEVLGVDEESIKALQQFFGYSMVEEDSKFQTILVLIGPTRSGKSVISRILKEILGTENTISPTISSFKNSHTTASLPGKKLCCIEDARYGDGKEAFKEFVLTMSGQDKCFFNPKNRDAFSANISAKFMMVGNALPNISDDGGAFAARMLLIKTVSSFLGKENPDLFNDLCKELPLIVWWALDGYVSLMEANRFVKPEKTRTQMEFITQQQSPVLEYVKSQCELNLEKSIAKEALYSHYKGWCLDEQIEPLFYTNFCRLLISNEEVKSARLGSRGSRTHHFVGISIKDHY